MSDQRTDRNRRKRLQNRARHDTPRGEAAPDPAKRRIQLAANICRAPATAIPEAVVLQLWERRAELLAALGAAGARADAAAPLDVYVRRFYGIDQAPESAEVIAADLGLGPTTVWNNLQRAYEVLYGWVASELPALLALVRQQATGADPLFWSKVRRDDPGQCWEWTGATDLGYGVLKRGGKKLQAHRYAYTLANGPPTPGMHLVHTCRNRLCVNPAHLREVAPGAAPPDR